MRKYSHSLCLYDIEVNGFTAAAGDKNTSGVPVNQDDYSGCCLDRFPEGSLKKIINISKLIPQHVFLSVIM